MRAPRGAGSNSSARLYAPAPAAWPFQRLARRALARPGRKRLDDVVAGAGSAAPLPVAPPAPQRTDRGFPGGIKAERRMQEQIFHESGHRAREKESGWMHGLASPAQRRARTKGGTSSTAPDRVWLGARAACVCVCSLWEKATRTRYSVEGCVAWGVCVLVGERDG